MDVEREPVERLRARVDPLGNPLPTRRGVQVFLRLPRTRCGTRGQNKLGQHEPRDDESARDKAQPVDGAKKTERHEERAHLDATADGGGAVRVAATRSGDRCIALFDGQPDERDRARDGD